MTTQYQLRFLDPLGTPLFTYANFVRIEYSRAENEIGALEIQLQPDFPILRIQKDTRIEILRAIDRKDSYVELETFWLARKIVTQQTDRGERTYKILAVDGIDLLRRRIVAYTANRFPYSYDIGTVDDVARGIIRRNMGSTAENSARDLSNYMTVQDDDSKGPAIQKDFAWRNVLDVIREIADYSKTNSQYFCFDVVRSDSTMMQFRIYLNQRGIDHGQTSSVPFVVSVDLRNLSSPVLEEDYTEESSYIYAGGSGEESLRLVTVAQDANRIASSPFGRVEYFVDQTNIEDLVSLQAEADAALRAFRPRRNFKGLLIQTQNSLYGVNYGYGDIVTVNYAGQVFDAHIDRIHVTYEHGQENIECGIQGTIFYG